MWKLYSAFTSETASRSFKELHMGQRYSCVSTLDSFLQKYVNSNIVNLIDSSYIKADNSTIFNWFQNNKEFIYKVAATDSNLESLTVLSAHAPRKRNSTYVHTVRRSIYETRQPEHPHFPICGYKQSPQLTPSRTRYM